MPLDEFLEVQVLGQGGRQQQPGVGHQTIVVEGRVEPVQAVRRSHQSGAPLLGRWVVSSTPSSQFRWAPDSSFRRLSGGSTGGSGLKQPEAAGPPSSDGSGDRVDVSALSQGTLDLVDLAARIGLVRLVTGDRRPPPWNDRDRPYRTRPDRVGPARPGEVYAECRRSRVRLRAGHMAPMRVLRASGVIAEAGAFLDASSTIPIVRAASEELAIELFRQDVYMRNGVWMRRVGRASGVRFGLAAQAVALIGMGLGGEVKRRRPLDSTT